MAQAKKASPARTKEEAQAIAQDAVDELSAAVVSNPKLAPGVELVADWLVDWAFGPHKAGYKHLCRGLIAMARTDGGNGKVSE